MYTIEIKQENNKVWRVTKLVDPDEDFNYYGVDIRDEAIELSPDIPEDIKNRILIVRVNKSSEILEMEYMGPKSDVTTIYSKGTEVTNSANKQALKQAIITYFDDVYGDSGFIENND